MRMLAAFLSHPSPPTRFRLAPAVHYVPPIRLRAAISSAVNAMSWLRTFASSCSMLLAPGMTRIIGVFDNSHARAIVDGGIDREAAMCQSGASRSVNSARRSG
jgi:hypothetical protein